MSITRLRRTNTCDKCGLRIIGANDKGQLVDHLGTVWCLVPGERHKITQR
jgi:hypothetical protein